MHKVITADGMYRVTVDYLGTRVDLWKDGIEGWQQLGFQETYLPSVHTYVFIVEATAGDVIEARADATSIVHALNAEWLSFSQP